MPQASDIFERECTNCGVCCFSDSPTHIRVLESDYERLGDLADELTSTVGDHRYMRIRKGRCVALAIEGERRIVCAIYAIRPVVCRELHRGSPSCLREIEEKEDRATQAVADSLIISG